MKKVIGLLSILILALALVACGNNKEASNLEAEENNNQEAPVEEVEEDDSEGTRTFKRMMEVA